MTTKKRQFPKGIKLRPDTDALIEEGEVKYDDTAKKVQYQDDSATRSVVSEDGVQTLENKTMDFTSATGNNTISADASDIDYDNASSTLVAADVKAALDEVDARLLAQDEADEITYDNTTSGLAAVEVQSAIDEVEARVDTIEAETYVNSFNTRTGDVTPAASDYDADQIDYDNTTSSLTATDTQAAIDEIDARIDSVESVGYVNSFNSRTGAVVPATSDYDADQIDYDNSGSGLTATDAQAAIDELDSSLDSHTGASSGVHGVTGSVVGTSDAQSISNKDINNSDINLGTASDSNKMVPSKDTTANLTALTREEGSLYYSTDDKLYKGDDGTNLIDLGKALEVEEEGVSVDTDVVKFNFIGPAVTATQSSPGIVDVTVINSPLAGGDTTLSTTILASDVTSDGTIAAWTKSLTSAKEYRVSGQVKFESPSGTQNIAVDIKENGNIVGRVELIEESGLSAGTACINCRFTSTGSGDLTFEVSGASATDFVAGDTTRSESYFVLEEIGIIAGGGGGNLLLSTNLLSSNITTDQTFLTLPIESGKTYRVAGQYAIQQDDADEFRIFIKENGNTIGRYVGGPPSGVHAYTKGLDLVFVATADGNLTFEAQALSGAGLSLINGNNSRSQTYYTLEEVIEPSGAGDGGDVLLNVEPSPGDIETDGVVAALTQAVESGKWYRTSGHLDFRNYAGFGGSIYMDIAENGNIIGRAEQTIPDTDQHSIKFNFSCIFQATATGNLTFTAGTGLANLQKEIQGGVGSNMVTFEELTPYANIDGAPIYHSTYPTVYASHKTAKAVAGGSTSAGVNTCPLNTLDGSDTDMGASLSSNQLTLPTGIYKISGWATGVESDQTSLYLYNSSDSTYDLEGQAKTFSSTNGDQGTVHIDGQITILDEKDFELRLYCGSAKATSGFGSAGLPGMPATNIVHSMLIVQKIG